MDVVISLNYDYLMPATVMLCSLFENNNADKITVHVLLGKGGDNCVDVLRNISNQYGQSICFYDMKRQNLIYLPTDRNGQRSNISIETYYRLFLTDVLPQTISKILYLDCDIVVDQNLRELYNVDIDSYALAAAPDLLNNDVHNANRLKYDTIYGYFNAGVLMINLDYWRKKNVKERFVSVIESNIGNLKYHDQDVLNYVFHDVRKELPLKFNFQTTFLFKDTYRFLSYKYHQEVLNTKNHAAVIHFTEDKPWLYDSPNPMNVFFMKYQNLTIYKGLRIKRKVSIKNRIIHTILCIQRKSFSYYKSNYDNY